MGAGKTTFVRGFAARLAHDLQVASPTFTFLRESNFNFQNEKWQLAHFDFFRLRKGSGGEILEILHEKLAQEKTLVLVEWAERLPKAILPEQRVNIFLKNVGECSRRISAQFLDFGVPTLGQIERIHREFATPLHVRAHENGVARVADFLAQRIFENGALLDLPLVHAGAALHDFVRLVNFPTLDFEKFPEKVTPRKVAIWEKLRQRFGRDVHHADAGAEILHEKKFSSCACVVAHHKSRQVLQSDPMTLEQKVVHFADKKVLHDRIVTLQERFDDGRQRHFCPSEAIRQDKETKSRALGQELFFLAGFANEREFDQVLLDS